ncbi:MAG: aromatic amino acid hydroxylase [Oligoflexia bacterium]|nr:aromatic amino acid hydroxylase [Oligoflexia bacterium]
MTQVEKIPNYLNPYIVAQDATQYTPIDHASWRYIMTISREFFAKHAHPLYLKGLKETGISTERIPLISEMDEKLRRFGWQAVAVSGFIPPAVFMEFLSRGILPIACDMRKLENIAYTPAPDIVHEAAGHAPIIADPEYAKYLRHYGELAEKAIFSKQDMDVYEAVRALSEIKEDPRSTPEEIKAAEMLLDEASAAVDHVSEATQLGRMGWWTIEYGLLGDETDPKIYGAGLLSSVGESYNCLKPHVKKIPLTVDCVDVTYDITRPQPQLFIARDFKALVQALDDLAERLAFRQGGVESLKKAKKAAALTTTVLESGIQISGVLERFECDAAGELSFLKYSGPVQLCHENKEIPGQGPEHHPQGFSSPVGKIRGLGKTAAELTDTDLKNLGNPARIQFESGIKLEGTLTGSTKKDGKIILLSFKDCAVRAANGDLLFDPSWGAFDLACGSRAISVHGWAADRARYLEATGGFNQAPGRQKTNLTNDNRPLNQLYARVRATREAGKPDAKAIGELATIHSELEARHPSDWLLRYELLELDHIHKLKSPWKDSIKHRLDEMAAVSQENRELIHRGLELIQ